MTSSIGVDRRILRAFYTQYVAVLLILLVFCVGSVYKGASPNSNRTSSSNTGTAIASARYPEFFRAPDSAEINDAGGIQAVSEVLKSHDLRGVFTIVAPLSGDVDKAVMAARLRARVLKTRMLQDRVPEQAIKVVIVPSAKPLAEVAVVFESLEVLDAES
jgi:hypothetical protein